MAKGYCTTLGSRNLRHHPDTAVLILPTTFLPLSIFFIPERCFSLHVKKLCNKTNNNKMIYYLDKKFCTFDVCDQRDWIVNCHSSRSISLRCKERSCSRSTITFWQIDHEIKLVVTEKIGYRSLLKAVVSTTACVSWPVQHRHLDNRHLHTINNSNNF